MEEEGSASGGEGEAVAAVASAAAARPTAEVTTPPGRAHTIRALAAALAAWLTTIAPAAFARSAPTSAKVLGALALVAALGGPIVPIRRISRHVGISVFLALATGTWLTSPTAIEPSHLDPTRGALGALAWCAFALSWSDPWRRAQPPPPDPSAPELLARTTLVGLAVPIAAFGAAAAFVCLALAWRVADAPRAIFAHAAALACAVSCIGASAAVAVSRGRRRTGSGRRMNAIAIRALLLLVAFTVAGVLATIAR